jgi:hypothetical protein
VHLNVNSPYGTGYAALKGEIKKKGGNENGKKDESTKGWVDDRID